MINNNMNQSHSQQDKETTEKKPNENAGLIFSSAIKIFDPNTKEILVQKRGDN